MDRNIYYGLVKFISEGKIPRTIKPQDQEKVRRTVSEFFLDDQDKLWIRSRGQNENARLVIAGSEKNEIMRQNHDSELAGHFGKRNTYDKIRRNYYWPGMAKDIDNWVTTCKQCQKRAPRSGSALMEPIQKEPNPFDHVGIDV